MYEDGGGRNQGLESSSISSIVHYAVRPRLIRNRYIKQNGPCYAG